MSNTPLTIAKLVRLGFSAEPVWLTREPPEAMEVHWISARLEDLQPGDLLLISAADTSAEIFRQAIHKGAAAVLLLGESAPPADRAIPAELPTAWIAESADLRQTQQQLIMLLMQQRAAMIERGVRIHSQLSQLAAGGGDLGELVIAIARLSMRGVVLQDKRLEVLAHSLPPALAGVWDALLDIMHSAENLPEQLRDRKQAGRQPALVHQELPGSLERLMVPIIAGGTARGYLSLIGPLGEIDLLDQIVVEQGSLVCAVAMSRLKAVREAEKRLKGDLLSALLQEDLSPRDAGLWVQAMGLDLSQAHVALRFAWDTPTPPSRRRLETLINGEVARLGLKVIVHPMSVEQVCFCEVSAGVARPTAALGLAQAVAEQGEREYPNIPIRCGIGAPAAGLESWRRSFHQAGQALELARRTGDCRPLYYADLSVYRLLLQIEHSPELVAFLEESLGPLLAHESSAELIHTLESYFEHNSNLSQTAEALFIHRNTLLYRMERIAAITGLNLDVPETRLAVQLALHIRKMMGPRPA